MQTKKGFRPTLWMSVFTVMALIVLILLGIWQVQRLGWKTDLIDRIEAAQQSEPIALPEKFEADLKYKPVKVRGKFLPEKRDYLFGRSYKGATGYLYLAPFQTIGGRTLIVNRGWVSETKRDPVTWTSSDFDQEIELAGLLRSGVWEGAKMFRPVNDPKADALIFIEPKLVAQRLGLNEVEPFYLDQIRPKNKNSFPVLLATKIDIPNNHLQYALTWFSFALILLVIYLMKSWRTVSSKQIRKES